MLTNGQRLARNGLIAVAVFTGIIWLAAWIVVRVMTEWMP